MRRLNEYVVIAVLLLVACLTHFGAAYADTTDPMPSRSVGAGSAAHPTGASAVVRQFYAWYIPQYNNGKEPSNLAPVRGLFDDRLYWLLKQLSSVHPGSKARGMECSLDADPFGLGQGLVGGARLSFTIGAPIAQGNAIVVPVTLFLVHTSPSGLPQITAIVKDEAGAYKIYDISVIAYGGGGLRQGLEQLARDPNCAWPK